jgi:hypothetical protein
LEIKKKLIKSCIWSFALYGSETWTLVNNEQRVVNVFETWYLELEKNVKNKMD